MNTQASAGRQNRATSDLESGKRVRCVMTAEDAERGVVVTVTVAVAVVEPSSVTEVGATEHTGPCDTTGDTKHLRFVVWLKPPWGATESVDVAVPPTATERAEALAEIEKSTPVPESGTV